MPDDDFNTLSPDDPLTLVYNATWTTLERWYEFGPLLKKGQLRKYVGGFRDPEKDARLTADVPEVAVLSLGSQPFPIQTSDSSMLEWGWSIELISGFKKFNVVASLDWIVYRAMLAWPTYILPLKWNFETFVREVRPFAIDETLRLKRETRAPSGWISLWTGKTRMVFDTATLRSIA